MQLIWTSCRFPAPLYHRLQAVARQRNWSMSQTISMLLGLALKTEEAKTRIRIYDAFERVRGRAKEPVTDASQTIDTLLYGHAGRT